MHNQQLKSIAQPTSQQKVLQRKEVSNLTMSLYMWPLLILLSIWNIVMTFSSSSGVKWLHCINLIVYICVYIKFIMEWRLEKRLEQKRQAAFRREPLPTYPLDHILPAQTLPLTLEHRFQWHRMGLLFIPIALFVWGIAPMLGFDLFDLTSFLFIQAYLVGLLLMVFVFSGYQLYNKHNGRLIIAPEGLVWQNQKATHSEFIPWQDIRLFAIDDVLFSNDQQRPIRIEVATSNKIIHWQWLGRNKKWLHFWSDPVIPHQAYDEQMQTALATISAKTGLPLYDLRER